MALVEYGKNTSQLSNVFRGDSTRPAPFVECPQPMMLER